MLQSIQYSWLARGLAPRRPWGLPGCLPQALPNQMRHGQPTNQHVSKYAVLVSALTMPQP